MACWVGAYLGAPIPLALVAFGFGAAVMIRSPGLVMIAGLMVASAFAARADSGAPVSLPQVIVGEVTLASDPEPIGRGVRFDVEHDGTRYEAVAWGAVAGQVRGRLLGERLDVEATVKPVDANLAWFRLRGVQARLTLNEVGGWRVGAIHHRLANSIRRTIESGASAMPRASQSLLVGLVYGDDRYQSDLMSDNFEAAGLTHLLAVSGQNVVFVMVIVGPLLRRFEFRGRFVATLVTLFLFATLTRFEASVMRASAMAAIAAFAVLLGRGASGPRFLWLAVSALVVTQPTIVHSLAFQLSVAASAGILIIAPRLIPLIPGPRLWSEAVAVTSAAQLAVAPLIIATFDELPVASLPANILAGPAAGPAMMWGLTGGLVAGLVPGVAPVLHLPTRLFVGWIANVAHVSAQLPLGSFAAVHIGVVAIALAALVWSRRSITRRLALVALAVAVLHPGYVAATPHRTSFVVGDSTLVWRDQHSTVLELGDAPLDDVLGELRRRHVGTIDLVVLPKAGFSDWDRLGSIRQRSRVRAVWAPSDITIPGVVVPDDGTQLVVGPYELTVVIDAGRLSLAPTPSRGP